KLSSLLSRFIPTSVRAAWLRRTMPALQRSPAAVNRRGGRGRTRPRSAGRAGAVPRAVGQSDVAGPQVEAVVEPDRRAHPEQGRKRRDQELPQHGLPPGMVVSASPEGGYPRSPWATGRTGGSAPAAPAGARAAKRVPAFAGTRRKSMGANPRLRRGSA